MSWQKIALGLAGLSGFTAVIAGSFGAHGLEKIIAASPENPETLMKLWEVAVRYHLTYTLVLALFGVLLVREKKTSLIVGALLSFSGILLFSGSFYARVLCANPSASLIAPFGGVCFMATWLTLLLFAVGMKPESHKR